MPIANTGLFYDPNFSYASLAGSTSTGTTYDDYVNETNRGGTWLQFLIDRGFNPMTTRGAAMNQMSNLAAQGYQAAQNQARAAGTQDLRWNDYLQSLDLQAINAGLTSNNRGERPDRYSGPIRYQPRAQ